MLEKIVELLGAILIGAYLGSKGYIAIDIFNKKLNYKAITINVICVAVWVYVVRLVY